MLPLGIQYDGFQWNVVAGSAQTLMQTPVTTGSRVDSDTPWFRGDLTAEHGYHRSPDVKSRARPCFEQSWEIVHAAARLVAVGGNYPGQ